VEGRLGGSPQPLAMAYPPEYALARSVLFTYPGGQISVAASYRGCLIWQSTLSTANEYRTPYLDRVQSSNLAPHVVRSLVRAATGNSMTGTPGSIARSAVSWQSRTPQPALNRQTG